MDETQIRLKSVELVLKNLDIRNRDLNNIEKWVELFSSFLLLKTTCLTPSDESENRLKCLELVLEFWSERDDDEIDEAEKIIKNAKFLFEIVLPSQKDFKRPLLRINLNNL